MLCGTNGVAKPRDELGQGWLELVDSVSNPDGKIEQRQTQVGRSSPGW
jgi:hypothetical protein